MDLQAMSKAVHFLKEKFPNLTYHEIPALLSDSLLRDIHLYIGSQKKKIFISEIRRILTRNIAFRSLFEGDEQKQTKIDFTLVDLGHALNNMRCINSCMNYRKKNSVYADLCEYFGKKNCEKNRYFFYKKWHGEMKSFEEMHLTKQVNDDHHAESSPNFPSHSETEFKNSAIESFNLNDNHNGASTDISLDKSKEIKCPSATPPTISTIQFSPQSVENVDKLSINKLNESSEKNYETEKHDISAKFLDSSREDSFHKLSNLLGDLKLQKTIIPSNSTNDPVPICGSYKNCTVFEGQFTIKRQLWAHIYKENKLDKSYPHVLKKYISAYVNNACILVLRYKKILKKSASINIYAECAHKGCKHFKIVISTISASVRIYSSSLNYHHKEYLTAQIKGVERDITKTKLLRQKPLSYKKEALLKCDETFINETKSLENIKSDSTMRKLRSEKLAQFDRDKNDLLDLVKLQSDKPHFFRELSFPFRATLFSADQVQILHNLFKGSSEELYIHFDATGSVVRHPYKEKKRIYLYTGVVMLKTRRIFPVLSMISAEHNSNAIFKLFHDFRYFCEEQNKWPSFSGIVTDFSFASIHAAIKAFNRITLLEYLEICYKIVDQGFSADNLITINLCCAHFMKMVCKDVEIQARNDQQKQLFKELLAVSININDLMELDSWFKNITVLLYSETTSELTQKSLETLCAGTKSGLKYENISEGVQTSDDYSLFRSSPFYKRYKNLQEDIKKDIMNPQFLSTHKENIYFNEEFLNTIHRKYIPFAPLWTCILKRKRLSNAIIENYFGYLKCGILEGQKNIKCSRFIRAYQNDIRAITNETKMNIGKSNLNIRKHDEIEGGEKTSQESWSRKPKGTSSHFSGTFMKQIDIGNKIVKEAVSHHEIVDNVIIIDETEATNEPSPEYPQTYRAKKCIEEIHAITLSPSQRELLSKNTVLQRESDLWRAERKRRITASFFFKICRCKTSTRENICKQIRNPVIINCEAVNHGIVNENFAREQYTLIRNVPCEMSGLVVHKTYPFLACSPDGLIQPDGMIEIKCPFSLRNQDPNKTELKFLDKFNELKTSCEYFYQIQGLLNICERKWCDLVIFTFEGIRILRVERNIVFWRENMLPKLKDFYYFDFLPFITTNERENKAINIIDRKWRTLNDLEFFDNGLVKDINYYKNIPDRWQLGKNARKPSDRNYVVTLFENLSCPVREIEISDYLSLDQGKYLTSFVIDNYISLIDTADIFQKFPVQIASSIFSDHPEENKTITIEKDYVALPINENNIHFVLIILDVKMKNFLFLDPLRRSKIFAESKRKEYFLKFSELLTRSERKNEIWNVFDPPIIHQEDSFNCGMYVIYYFQQYILGKPLNENVNINNFRNIVKGFFLEKSSSMHDRCLYCSKIAEFNFYSCLCCKRKLHISCLTNKTEPQHEFVNSICDLCRNY